MKIAASRFNITSNPRGRRHQKHQHQHCKLEKGRCTVCCNVESDEMMSDISDVLHQMYLNFVTSIHIVFIIRTFTLEQYVYVCTAGSIYRHMCKWICVILCL